VDDNTQRKNLAFCNVGYADTLTTNPGVYRYVIVLLTDPIHFPPVPEAHKPHFDRLRLGSRSHIHMKGGELVVRSIFISSVALQAFLLPCWPAAVISLEGFPCFVICPTFA